MSLGSCYLTSSTDFRWDLCDALLFFTGLFFDFNRISFSEKKNQLYKYIKHYLFK